MYSSASIVWEVSLSHQCSHYGNSRMVLHLMHISIKQWAKNFRSSEYYFMLFNWVSSCCYCPSPGWLDSNDACMSGGWWACGGGTTKGRGHCGHSRWGNTSHHRSSSTYPHTHIPTYKVTKVFPMKISTCKDGALINQPNKMGTAPQHIHTIPTSCAIYPAQPSPLPSTTLLRTQHKT